MTDQEWHATLKSFNVKDIDERIEVLKERIRSSQTEIVILTIVRAAFKKKDEMTRISQAKADAAIDEALREARLGSEPAPVEFTTEGGIK